MTYTEYNKKHAIKIGRKHHNLRSAIYTYLSQYVEENDEYLKVQKVLDSIVQVLQKINFEVDNSDKVIISKQIIIALVDIDFLSKETWLLSKIIKYLKKKKIVSKKSQSEINIHKDFDPNRLTDCFIATNFSMYDNIIKLQNQILDIILTTNDDITREQYIFHYLKYFSIKKYRKEVFSYFKRSNIFNLNSSVVLIYKKVHNDDYESVEIVYFDELLNDVLLNIFFNNSVNLFDRIDHYFTAPLKVYERNSGKFLEQSYFTITGNSLRDDKKHYFANLIKRHILLKHQIHNSPLNVTLELIKLYPHSNYLELMHLFPDLIKDKELEKIEKDNIQKQKHSFMQDLDEVSDSVDIKEYMKLDTNAYTKFKEIKQFTVKNKNEYKRYVIKLDNFIKRNENEFIFPQMFEYVRYLISKSKFSNNNKENWATSTVYGALSIIFTSCYNFIISEGKLDISVVELIEKKVDLFKNKDTYRKYLNVINPFLNQFDYHIGEGSSKSVVYARKSLIFKKELDTLYEVLVKKDKEIATNIQTAQDDSYIITHQRFLFCVLMYYCGLRESELWSRHIKDLYLVGVDKVVIDVNTNQDIKSLKTLSARRRVEFTIDDERYFGLFCKYLDILENKKVKYLFPEYSKSYVVSKKNLQKLSYFQNCNQIIQKITGRYTSLHSFRHTYATNSMRKLILNPEKQKNGFYNFINMIGHLGPLVTLRYYIHLDYVVNFKNNNLF